MLKNQANKKFIKWILVGGFILLLSGAGIYMYFVNLKYEDTAVIKSDFTVEAIPLIREFEKDINAANKKYAEKIIEVTGMVAETEAADTTINIKMIDTTYGSYLIFAFQQNHLQEAKTLKVGNKATIKGSCSDGIFSDILGTYFISFKRSTLLQ